MGWGPCYSLMVGRMFYHVGSPLGPTYESHPWRKGWPTVASEAVFYTISC